jgi:hypothetical protein
VKLTVNFARVSFTQVNLIDCIEFNITMNMLENNNLNFEESGIVVSMADDVVTVCRIKQFV